MCDDDCAAKVAALALKAIYPAHDEDGSPTLEACQLCDAEWPDGEEAEHSVTCPLADLPAASKAILAAAEREPGLREALQSVWIADDNDGLWLRIELSDGRKAAFNLGRADARRITVATVLGWQRVRDAVLTQED